MTDGQISTTNQLYVLQLQLKNDKAFRIKLSIGVSDQLNTSEYLTKEEFSNKTEQMQFL